MACKSHIHLKSQAVYFSCCVGILSPLAAVCSAMLLLFVVRSLPVSTEKLCPPEQNTRFRRVPPAAISSPCESPWLPISAQGHGTSYRWVSPHYRHCDDEGSREGNTQKNSKEPNLEFGSLSVPPISPNKNNMKKEPTSRATHENMDQKRMKEKHFK